MHQRLETFEERRMDHSRMDTDVSTSIVIPQLLNLIKYSHWRTLETVKPLQRLRQQNWSEAAEASVLEMVEHLASISVHAKSLRCVTEC